MKGDGRTEARRAADRARGAESVEQGAWGERVAAEYLSARGYHVVERNARPCRADRRCELDLVVQDGATRAIVFVEVKTHKRRSVFARRLWAVDRRKRALLYRGCVNWILRRRWHGSFRFDVIEVYGSRGDPTPPEIDHIRNVRLFPAKWRFWRGEEGREVPMLKEESKVKKSAHCLDPRPWVRFFKHMGI